MGREGFAPQVKFEINGEMEIFQILGQLFQWGGGPQEDVKMRLDEELKNVLCTEDVWCKECNLGCEDAAVWKSDDANGDILGGNLEYEKREETRSR